MEMKKKKLVGVEDPQIEKKRIMIFLLITFVISWFTEIFGVIPMYRSGDVETVQEAVKTIGSLMFAPAFGALIARLMTREGLAHSGIQFNFYQHKWLFLFSWFGMSILTLLGAVVYFVIFKNNYDPEMKYFISNYVGSEIDSVQIIAAFKTDILIKLFTAPVLDIINSFGEEWGWRAYLLPKLYRKFGTVPAVLLSGLISGLWYAPLVSIGYFYGTGYAGEPVTGILAMCLFSTVTGVIYATVSLKTGSIFPAAFAHSALSVMMSQAANMTVDGGSYFVGPAPTGIVAGIPLIIAAGICLWYLIKYPVKPSVEPTTEPVTPVNRDELENEVMEEGETSENSEIVEEQETSEDSEIVEENEKKETES